MLQSKLQLATEDVQSLLCVELSNTLVYGNPRGTSLIYESKRMFLRTGLNLGRLVQNITLSVLPPGKLVAHAGI